MKEMSPNCTNNVMKFVIKLFVSKISDSFCIHYTSVNASLKIFLIVNHVFFYATYVVTLTQGPKQLDSDKFYYICKQILMRFGWKRFSRNFGLIWKQIPLWYPLKIFFPKMQTSRKRTLSRKEVFNLLYLSRNVTSDFRSIL